MKNKESRVITGRISVNNGKSVCVKEKKPSSGTGIHRKDGELSRKPRKDGTDNKPRTGEPKRRGGFGGSGLGERGGKKPN